ncbi:hypothetical protein T4D_1200 [Trichinella pseudospiralis]|uniref:Uncharacterized protein n=1 Tax=Trichinella pseudospiralis TaxID=6337 RepID=A0A0V1G6F7_TRIPS|nr:hypothetical protein T4D_1200 [Trichinella pseudospiralis]
MKEQKAEFCNLKFANFGHVCNNRYNPIVKPITSTLHLREENEQIQHRMFRFLKNFSIQAILLLSQCTFVLQLKNRRGYIVKNICTSNKRISKHKESTLFAYSLHQVINCELIKDL